MARSKDFDIRRDLVAALLAAGVERSSIRHEITLDTSSSGGRADLVVLTDDALICFEIKSGADNLDRLPEQRRAAERAMDLFRTALDERHRASINDYAKGLWWARDLFWCADVGFTKGFGEPLVPTLPRDPHHRSRSGTTSVVDMARMLWRDEAVAVAGALGASVKTREAAINHIREHGSLRVIRPLVIRELRSRPPSRWDDAFWSRFDIDQPASERP